MTAIPALTPQPSPSAAGPQSSPTAAGSLFAAFFTTAEGEAGAAPGLDGFPAAESSDAVGKRRKTILAGLEASLVGLGAMPAPVAAPGAPAIATPANAGTSPGAVSLGAVDAAAGRPGTAGEPQPVDAPSPTDVPRKAMTAADGGMAKTDRGETPAALAEAGVTELTAKSEVVARKAAGAPELAPPSVPQPPTVAIAPDKSSVGAEGKSAEPQVANAAAPAKPAAGASAGDMAGSQGDAGENAPDQSPQQAHAPAKAEAAASTDRPAAAQTSATPATPSAQAPAATQVAAATVAAQVAREIASHAGGRRTRFEVRLDPAELGRVDVRLDIAHDGRVQTRLIVERPETLDMLRHDARELARTLEQAGFQLGQGGLAFQLRDGRRETFENVAATDRPTGGAVEEPVEAAPEPYATRSRAAAGGVDVTV